MVVKGSNVCLSHFIIGFARHDKGNKQSRKTRTKIFLINIPSIIFNYIKFTIKTIVVAAKTFVEIIILSGYINWSIYNFHDMNMLGIAPKHTIFFVFEQCISDNYFTNLNIGV